LDQPIWNRFTPVAVAEQVAGTSRVAEVPLSAVMVSPWGIHGVLSVRKLAYVIVLDKVI
jgi:hypothetical protein